MSYFNLLYLFMYYYKEQYKASFFLLKKGDKQKTESLDKKIDKVDL